MMVNEGAATISHKWCARVIGKKVAKVAAACEGVNTFNYMPMKLPKSREVHTKAISIKTHWRKRESLCFSIYEASKA